MLLKIQTVNIQFLRGSMLLKEVMLDYCCLYITVYDYCSFKKTFFVQQPEVAGRHLLDGRENQVMLVWQITISKKENITICMSKLFSQKQIAEL